MDIRKDRYGYWIPQVGEIIRVIPDVFPTGEYTMSLEHAGQAPDGLIEIINVKVRQNSHGNFLGEAEYFIYAAWSDPTRPGHFHSFWVPSVYMELIGGTFEAHRCEWKTYFGFTDTFEYCDCGNKK